MAHQIELKTLPRRDLAVVKFRATPATIPQQIGAAFGAVYQYCNTAGVTLEAPAIAFYKPGTEEFEVSAGFIVAAAVSGDGHVVPAELPAGEAAFTTHMGGYDSLPAAYTEIQTWMKAHGYEPAEVMWEQYWSEPNTPPAKTRTDIVWPVKPER